MFSPGVCRWNQPGTWKRTNNRIQAVAAGVLDHTSFNYTLVVLDLAFHHAMGC